MSKSPANQRSLYVYAFAPAFAQNDHPLGPIGLDESEVRLICEGSLAAATSVVPLGRLRPKRRHIAAHQAVLRQLMQHVTVLPASFGLLADHATAVRALLVKHQTMLAEQLAQVKGKVEMGLRVVLDVPNLFDYFVERHASLKAIRQQLAGRSDVPRSEMIEVGRLFDQILRSERDRYTHQVVDVLEQAGVEVVVNAPRSEREIMHLACLVDKEPANHFESVLAEAAADFDNHFLFDFDGPWAPHHFTTLHLQE